VTIATNLVTGLLFAYLLVVVPFRGQIRYRRFQREIASDPTARLRYYQHSLIWKYMLSLVAIALYFANGQDANGLPLVATEGTQPRTLLALGAGLGLGALLIRWRLAQPARRVKLARSIRGFADLIPRTDTERRVWVVAAISAGITEEILYRAFVMIVVANVLPDANTATVVAISAAAFGLAHLYQGPRGILLTAVVGAALGAIVVSSGLLLAIAVHAVIDLRVLIIPPELAAEATELRSDGPADQATGPAAR
jgi:CAAX protease family protein